VLLKTLFSSMLRTARSLRSEKERHPSIHPSVRDLQLVTKLFVGLLASRYCSSFTEVAQQARVPWKFPK
jgi:hypothetical protein